MEKRTAFFLETGSKILLEEIAARALYSRKNAVSKHVLQHFEAPMYAIYTVVGDFHGVPISAVVGFSRITKIRTANL